MYKKQRRKSNNCKKINENEEKRYKQDDYYNFVIQPRDRHIMQTINDVEEKKQQA